MKRLVYYGLFVYDYMLIPLAWLGAVWLHHDFVPLSAALLLTHIKLIPLIMVIQGVCIWYFGLYRASWRYVSMSDVLRLCKATVLTLLVLALMEISRAQIIIYAFLFMAGWAAPRLVCRYLYHRTTRHDTEIQKVLIVGAGSAGEGLVRDLLRNPNHYKPMAFVDDKRSKRGREIHGVRVMGKCADLPELVTRLEIDLIFIAIPSARSISMQRMVRICNSTDVPFYTLPSLTDLATGKVNVQALRKVNIEDLLGRDTVELNWSGMAEQIQDKSVLVTGGGGSIGSELSRQIAKLAPRELIIIENCEFNLYQIQLELQKDHPELTVHAHLVDIFDEVAVKTVFAQYHPQIVYHAAAYKHVPIVEANVRSAVRNNILGTRIVVEAAHHANAEHFILISTDKAVHPNNLMGASKRMAEMIVQHQNAHSTTCFTIVRFGNVLGSTGSVVPLFTKQIEQGGPVTITHPECTRFFMTIPEATQLILEALTIANNGEIFVLDMGEPISIKYMAEQMIKLSGKETKIEYIGLRPGEKLHETLFYEHEQLQQTSYDKIFQAPQNPIEPEVMQSVLDNLLLAYESNDISSMTQLLKFEGEVLCET